MPIHEFKCRECGKVTEVYLTWDEAKRDEQITKNKEELAYGCRHCPSANTYKIPSLNASMKSNWGKWNS